MPIDLSRKTQSSLPIADAVSGCRAAAIAHLPRHDLAGSPERSCNSRDARDFSFRLGDLQTIGGVAPADVHDGASKMILNLFDRVHTSDDRAICRTDRDK